jgi:hypothetical protein
MFSSTILRVAEHSACLYSLLAPVESSSPPIIELTLLPNYKTFQGAFEKNNSNYCIQRLTCLEAVNRMRPIALRNAAAILLLTILPIRSRST